MDLAESNLKTLHKGIMDRSQLNTSSRREEDDVYSHLNFADNTSMYSRVAENSTTNDRVHVQYRGLFLFTVTDERTQDFVEVQLIPFGRRCMIRLNDLGWYDLVDIAKFVKATPKVSQPSNSDYETQIRAICIHCNHGEPIEISYCTLEMFGQILEQLRPHVEKYVDHSQDDIAAVYDQYRRAPPPPFVPFYAPICRPPPPPQQQMVPQPQQSRQRQLPVSPPPVSPLPTSPTASPIPRKKKGDLWRIGKSKSTIM